MLLGNEEPDYQEIFVQINTTAIRHLKTIANSEDEMLASKAVYLASLFSSQPSAQEIVRKASKSDRSLLKLAAASALPNLEISKRNELAEELIDEQDIGIKKLVIKSLDKNSSSLLKEKLQILSRESQSTYIKNLSDKTFIKITN